MSGAWFDPNDNDDLDRLARLQQRAMSADLWISAFDPHGPFAEAGPFALLNLNSDQVPLRLTVAGAGLSWADLEAKFGTS